MNAAKDLQRVQRENERLKLEASELRAQLAQNMEKYHLYYKEKFGVELTD